MFGTVSAVGFSDKSHDSVKFFCDFLFGSYRLWQIFLWLPWVLKIILRAFRDSLKIFMLFEYLDSYTCLRCFLEIIINVYGSFKLLWTFLIKDLIRRTCITL